MQLDRSLAATAARSAKAVTRRDEMKKALLAEREARNAAEARAQTLEAALAAANQRAARAEQGLRDNTTGMLRLQSGREASDRMLYDVQYKDQAKAFAARVVRQPRGETRRGDAAGGSAVVASRRRSARQPRPICFDSRPICASAAASPRLAPAGPALSSPPRQVDVSEDGNFDVEYYEDREVETRVPPSRMTLLPAGATPPFRQGEAVEARRKGKGEWVAGYVDAEENGRYDVYFPGVGIGGSDERGMPGPLVRSIRAWLEPGTKVEVGEEMARGTILRDRGDGSFDVDVDGAGETAVPRAALRPRFDENEPVLSRYKGRAKWYFQPSGNLVQ